MQVIIVGDDQPLRVQLARSLGVGRFDMVCAVPHAEQVPSLAGREPLLALVAHRSALTTRAEATRLRERFGGRLTMIAVSNAPDPALSQTVIDGVVDDIVVWAHGPAFLQARLDVIARRAPAAATARATPSAFLAAVASTRAPMSNETSTMDPTLSALRRLLGVDREALEAGTDAADRQMRDHVFMWDTVSGEVTWPLEADPEAAGLPDTRAAWDERVHGDDVPTREAAIDQQLALRHPYALGVRMRFGSEGERRFRTMLERGVVLEPDGEKARTVIGILTDIDPDLRQDLARHLAQRRALVAELAGALAEELNASLLGAFTNLDQVIDTLPPSVTRSDLDQARASLQGAFDWTRRLLALGRRTPPQPEYVSLQDVVHDLVDRLARQLGSHIELVVEARESPGVVLADPHQLETVLTTLCERAARAMPPPEGGRVTITLGASNLRDEAGILPMRATEGRWARLRVIDQGPPLGPGAADGNFDSLSNGLGGDLSMVIALATVRAIIGQHDGFVRGLDLPEGGVAFEIFLPVVTRPPARLRRPQSGMTTPVGGGEWVLVCDDDELVARMIERLLKSAGYQVLTAHDGEEAVALVERYKDQIRVCLLDIVMPVMGGRVASERIRAVVPSVPCIFMSGYTMSIQDTEFVQDASRHFIPKPFNAGQLLREIRIAIEGKHS